VRICVAWIWSALASLRASDAFDNESDDSVLHLAAEYPDHAAIRATSESRSASMIEMSRSRRAWPGAGCSACSECAACSACSACSRCSAISFPTSDADNPSGISRLSRYPAAAHHPEEMIRHRTHWDSVRAGGAPGRGAGTVTVTIPPRPLRRYSAAPLRPPQPRNPRRKNMKRARKNSGMRIHRPPTTPKIR
jgi:hypothetical protein